MPRRADGVAEQWSDGNLTPSRCLRLALDWKLITENPAQGLKKYNEDNRRDRLMTDSELQRLMAVLDTDPARTPCLVIKWLLYTACRKGEALHLRWADINRDNNTWTIQAANAKSKKRRVVPLNSGALAILSELQPGNTSDWVFLNSRTGERLQSIDRVWNQRIRIFWIRQKRTLKSMILAEQLP